MRMINSFSVTLVLYCPSIVPSLLNKTSTQSCTCTVGLFSYFKISLMLPWKLNSRNLYILYIIFRNELVFLYSTYLFVFALKSFLLILSLLYIFKHKISKCGWNKISVSHKVDLEFGHWSTFTVRTADGVTVSLVHFS